MVAFWDLHPTDVFVCNRFFIIPSPVKRVVKDAKGTQVHEVLFTSPHTNDVFFFWKGAAIQSDDSSSSLDDSIDSIKETKTCLQIGFLNL